MIPQKLRAQFDVYRDAGFTPVDAVPRKGSHWAVTFEEFPEVQFLTTNIGDPHALRNNLARFRRLKEAQHATA